MNFDREDKMLLGIGVVGVLTIGTIAIVLSGDKKKGPKKPSYGLKVGPQCSTWEFTDETKAKESITDLVEREAKQGAVDPFKVTTVWLRASAGQCQAYPAQTRNPGEASLYRDVFTLVLDTMVSRQLLSDDMLATYQQMIDTWAASQGVQIGLA